MGWIKDSQPIFFSELKNVNFKKALVNFFILDWESNHYAPFMKNKNVFLNYEKCYKYSVTNDIVVKEIDDVLTCPQHEEADKKITYHISNIDYESNVVVRCSDSDILIILLGNISFIKKDVKVWMHVGVGNARRFLNVTVLSNKLGSKLCNELPAFYAFTGCDYNPSFYRKGKNRPFTILKKSENYMDAF